MSAQPGWYNQPDGSQRYWDGRNWTQHTRVQSDPTPPPPGAHHAAETPPTPFYKNKVFIVVAVAGALVVAVSAMRGGGSEPEAAPQAVAVITATATVTVEVPAPTPDVTTPPVSTEPVEDAPIEATPDSDDWEETAHPETFKMPKLVGKNLQLAQDKLQSLGSWVLDQEDASGLDRFQILDSNWKVCSQKPKAGKVVSVNTVVVLKSVKLDEKCP